MKHTYDCIYYKLKGMTGRPLDDRNTPRILIYGVFADNEDDARDMIGVPIGFAGPKVFLPNGDEKNFEDLNFDEHIKQIIGVYRVAVEGVEIEDFHTGEPQKMKRRVGERRLAQPVQDEVRERRRQVKIFKRTCARDNLGAAARAEHRARLDERAKKIRRVGDQEDVKAQPEEPEGEEGYGDQSPDLQPPVPQVEVKAAPQVNPFMAALTANLQNAGRSISPDVLPPQDEGKAPLRRPPPVQLPQHVDVSTSPRRIRQLQLSLAEKESRRPSGVRTPVDIRRDRVRLKNARQEAAYKAYVMRPSTPK